MKTMKNGKGDILCFITDKQGYNDEVHLIPDIT
jgi:hypothetical protein